MPQYIFILGREPELAVAEIAAAAAIAGVLLEFRRVSHDVALVEGELPSGFTKRLAGTIKFAEVWGSVYKPTQAATEKFLLNHLAGDRVEFGFSWYGRTPPPWLTASGLEIKNRLKGRGHVRFVTSRASALSSVIVAKNNLLPPVGYDVVMYPQPDTLTIGRTIWIQDFEAWGERDFGRPQRNAKVGMLPPKLAHIMLNLAFASLRGEKALPWSSDQGQHLVHLEGKRFKQLNRFGSLLDPVCGSGTVLQEAALMGCTDITGSDSDARGVKRSKKNFVWLRQQHPEITTEPKMLVCDIRKLPSLLKGKTYDCIVTEPYLGPPQTGKETALQLKQIHSELTTFYQTTLGVLASLLAPAGRIVMIWPIIKVGKDSHLLPLDSVLQQFGLKLIDVLPSGVPKEWRSARGTLTYERPDARVGREIVVLQSKK